MAIIAILAALLLPALQKGKERGRQAACMNNLRQIYLAFANYAGDYNDAMPPMGTSYFIYRGTRGMAWHHFLGKAGYLGRMETFGSTGMTRWPVLRCPSDLASFRPNDGTFQGNGISYYDYKKQGCSYVMNWSVSRYWYYPAGDIYDPTWSIDGGGPCYCGPLPDCCANYPFRRFSSRPDNLSPSEAPFVMDCTALGGDSGWPLALLSSWVDDDPSWFTSVWYYDGQSSYAFRHLGYRANMLYLDGHVDTVRPHIHTGQNVYKEIWAGDP